MSSSINVSIVLYRNKVHLGIRHNDYKYLSSGAAKRSFFLRLGVMQVLYDFAKRQRFTIAVVLNDILRDPTPKTKHTTTRAVACKRRDYFSTRSQTSCIALYLRHFT